MKVVSILVPCYKQVNFLRDCIISLIQQSYTHIEILIADDGSNDGSFEIIEEFRKKDSRIKNLSSFENHGLIQNFNKLFDSAIGDFIAFFSGDDVMMPLKIERQVELLLKRPDIDLVQHSAIQLSAENKQLGVYQKALTPNVDPLLEIVNLTAFNYKKHRVSLPTTFLARRDYFLKSRYNNLFLRKHELYFMAENHLKGNSKKWYYIDQPLSKYRVHSENFSAQTNDTKLINLERLLLLELLDENYGITKYTTKKRREIKIYEQIFSDENLLIDWDEKSTAIIITLLRFLNSIGLYWRVSRILHFLYDRYYKILNIRYIKGS